MDGQACIGEFRQGLTDCVDGSGRTADEEYSRRASRKEKRIRERVREGDGEAETGKRCLVTGGLGESLAACQEEEEECSRPDQDSVQRGPSGGSRTAPSVPGQRRRARASERMMANNNAREGKQ